MGGSARYRLAKKVREGKITADDLTFSVQVNKQYADENKWDLEDNDFTILGYDDNGNAYEVDAKGNPTKLAKPNYEKDWENVESSESLNMAEAKRKLARMREEPENEYDAGEDWWDNGGKEATLYGL